MTFLQKLLPRTPSEIVLIIANMLPVIGVSYFGWSLGEAMLVYWLENVIIGIMNVFKMAIVGLFQRSFGMVFAIPFFIMHYGIFTAVHGAFVVGVSTMDSTGKLHGTLEDFLFSLDLQSVCLTIIAIAASHFFSFVYNFIGKREYQRIAPDQLMGAPYGRVIMLHLSLLFGMFLVFATGHNAAVLILLTIFKTFADLMLHRKSHEKLAQDKSPA